MTDQLYRIKPLDWGKKSNEAVTSIGTYRVTDNPDEFVSVRHPFALLLDDLFVAECRDTPAAKAAAEAHYRERLMEALEPVTPDTIMDLWDELACMVAETPLRDEDREVIRTHLEAGDD